MISEWLLMLVGVGGGLIGGIILYFLSTEESRMGKYYFFSTQMILFSILLAVGIFSFANQGRYWLLVGSIVPGLIVLAIHWIYKVWWSGLLMYILGAGYILFFQDEMILMFVVSLLFILGLPTGTLLMVNYNDKKQKARTG